MVCSCKGECAYGFGCMTVNEGCSEEESRWDYLCKAGVGSSPRAREVRRGLAVSMNYLNHQSGLLFSAS